MKKSSAVALVISGAMLAGCDSSDQSWENSQTYTNDQYIAGRGYYHAPYRAWYPFPYNHYDYERRAYYHGGNYTAEPLVSPVTMSKPLVSLPASSANVRRGGFTMSRSVSS